MALCERYASPGTVAVFCAFVDRAMSAPIGARCLKETKQADLVGA
jgi:hypothetical protein